MFCLSEKKAKRALEKRQTLKRLAQKRYALGLLCEAATHAPYSERLYTEMYESSFKHFKVGLVRSFKRRRTVMDKVVAINNARSKKNFY